MAFRFFITKPRKSENSSSKVPHPEKIYGIGADGIPCKEMPDVVLFGKARQSYYESLVMAIFCREGVRLKVSRVYEHPGFQGDEVIMPYTEFIGHIESMVGSINHLPLGAVVSMEQLLERIKKATVKENNLKGPH